MTNANQSWNEKRYNEIALKWLAGAVPDSTAADDLRIVPNPADDMVWISLQGAAAEGQSVQVFSMDGRQVFSGILPSVGSLAIPVKDWQGGLYIVKITGDGTAIALKFMVQHP